MRKVGLYTLGCKVSLYETEAISEAFSAAGYEVAPFSEVCDVYVINTCTVTAESDAKSRKYIRRAIRNNPDAVVIVIGCYSQRAPEEVAAIDGVSAVLGTADKMKCVEIANRLIDNSVGASMARPKNAESAFSVGVAERHERVRKQHSALFSRECDRAAARGGPLAVDEVCDLLEVNFFHIG